jgi:septum formation protein
MQSDVLGAKTPKAGTKAVSLFLASASSTRAEILRKAGVPFTAEPAAVDETEMKRALAAEGATPTDAALALAELKARKVAARHPGALVIGADQILECNGVWFDKPPDLDHARAQLKSLRGRAHRLISSVCVVRDGERVWHETDTAELTMRRFSDTFLDSYLQKVGNAVCGWVGAYQIEGLGAQLFSRVRGDHHTILGLPLLPLLAFLREHGVVAA